MRPPDDAVRQLAAEILERPEFSQTWEENIFLALIRLISRFVDWLEAIRVASPAIYWLILAGLLSVALLLIFHIAWSIRAALSAPAPEVPQPTVRRQPRFAQEAAELARQGRFLEASHRMLLASIHSLLQSGAIELARHQPNSTLRREIRRSALPRPLRGEFIDLLDRLERSWFRDRNDEPELYDSWRRLHRQLAGAGGSPP